MRLAFERLTTIKRLYISYVIMQYLISY